MYTNNYPLLGVLGGMGPYAGLDFTKKIFANTKANKDQEHLPVLMASLPHEIPGRPEFLMDIQPVNPGKSMADLALWLEKAGVTHIAVPCNTAHAAPIWKLMLEELEKANSKVVFIHIIEEVKKEVASQLANKEIQKPKIGLLATTGTIQTGLYPSFFNEDEFEIVYPTDKYQEKLMDAIFSKAYGLKAFSENIKPEALAILQEVLEDLKAQNVDLFILGCTELPFALTEKSYLGLPCIDPVAIQARALIKATYPEKLID